MINTFAIFVFLVPSFVQDLPVCLSKLLRVDWFLNHFVKLCSIGATWFLLSPLTAEGKDLLYYEKVAGSPI
jgi:hypothetical protein